MSLQILSVIPLYFIWSALGSQIASVFHDLSSDAVHTTNHQQTFRHHVTSISNGISSIYNPILDTNLSIFFNNTPTLVIDHQNDSMSLHILNDSEWDEISIISTLEPVPFAEFARRSLMGVYSRHHRYRGPKRYHAVRQGKNFKDAERYCKSSHKGHLVTITTAFENEKVSRLCESLGVDWHCWIGLRRPFTTWLDGSVVNFDEWMPGEPNNFGNNEACTEIMSEHQRWNDENCGNKRSFICQSYPGKNRLNQRWRLSDRRSRKRAKVRRAKREERRDERTWKKILRREQYRRYKRRMERHDRERAERIARRRRKRWRKQLRRLRKKRMEKMKAQFIREMEMEKRRESAYHLLNKLIESAVMDHGAGSLPKGALQTLAKLKGQTKRRLINGDNDDGDDLKLDSITMVVRCKMMDELQIEICVRQSLEDPSNRNWSVDLKSKDNIDSKQQMVSMDRSMETIGNPISETIYVDRIQLELHSVYGVEENVVCGSVPYVPYRMCIQQKGGDAMDTVMYFEKDDEDENENGEKALNEWRVLERVLHFGDDRDWDRMNEISSLDGQQWTEKCRHLSIAIVCLQRFNESDSRGSIQFVSKRA